MPDCAPVDASTAGGPDQGAMTTRQSVVNHAFFNLDLEASDTRVLATLVKAANPHGDAIITIKDIAAASHLGLRTIARSLNKLEQLGYVKRAKAPAKAGILPTNTYLLFRKPASPL
jgi:predicted transcriptional regulator